MNLKEKAVLITGASVGIGRETAYLFAKEKAKIIITYLKSKKEAKATARQCKKLGSQKVLLLKIDITKSKNIESAIKKVAKKFKTIDILINNAGIIRWKHLQKQSYRDIEAQIETNLTGLIKITKTSLPLIKKAIINISSRSGLEGHERLTTYCATKFGVRGFTKALACETHLKVLSVNPPLTKTRMSDYQGIPAKYVANIILETAQKIDQLESGSDIAVPRPNEN